MPVIVMRASDTERALHRTLRHDTFMALRGTMKMDWDDYFRQQAAMYRQLAEKTEDVFIKQELLDLAAVCEEVANNIEDRRTSG